MLKTNRTLLAVAIAALTAQANAGVVTTDGADIVIKTKGGFEAKTADGEYGFKIGGRMQLDYNDFDGVTNADALDPGTSADDIFFSPCPPGIERLCGRLEV